MSFTEQDQGWVIGSPDKSLLVSDFDEEDGNVLFVKHDGSVASVVDAFCFMSDEDAFQELEDIERVKGRWFVETVLDDGSDPHIEIEPGERPELGVFFVEFKPHFLPVQRPHHGRSQTR